jgi:transposase
VMKIHSGEVRGLALSALERGEGRANVSRTLCIPLGTLDRWWREYRQSGKTAPSKRGHLKRQFDAGNLALLEEQLRQKPDATAHEQARIWQERTGRAVSVSTLRRARLALGWSHKKRVCVPANKTPAPV